MAGSPPLATGPGRAAIAVIDAQAAGDVSRVVLGGVVLPPGKTLLECARWLEREADGLRRLLLSPPYGDPTMSVDLVIPAVDPKAEAGFIIMEAMGYPSFSGSNAMCTAAALLETGRLPIAEGPRRLLLEAPAGPVTLTADCRAGRVNSVSYATDPAFVMARGQGIDLPGGGRACYDLVFGGVFYAVVDAAEIGLDLPGTSRGELAAFGTTLVAAARHRVRLEHPLHGDTDPLAFALFVGRVETRSAGLQAPVAAYVHPGVICHGPTGTGTTALLALLAADERIASGVTLTTLSPEGHRFCGTITGRARVGAYPAVRAVITGWPSVLAYSRVFVDAVGNGLGSLLDRTPADRVWPV